MALTDDQVYLLARGAGLAPSRAVVATAVAHPESGLNPSAHNDNPSTGDDSWGLWQINMIGKIGPARRARYGLHSNSDLLDPKTNARVMAGESGQGLNFTPWTTYRNGEYRQFLPQAQAAAARVDKLSPSDIEKIIGAIASGVGSATSGDGGGQSLLQKALSLPETLYNLYSWLPGPPAPSAEATAAARHGLLRIGEVVGGVILVIIGMHYLLEPVMKPATQAAGKLAAVAAAA